MANASRLNRIEALLARVAEWIRNGWTIVVAVVAISAIVGAVLSGVGRDALCHAYLEIVHREPEHWQPLAQQWSDAWLVVEDVLERGPHPRSVTTESVETREISATHYQFRWPAGDGFRRVDVEQDTDGVWMVNTLPDTAPGWCD